MTIEAATAAVLAKHTTVKVGRGAAIHLANHGAVICNGNSNNLRAIGHAHTCTRCDRILNKIVARKVAG